MHIVYEYATAFSYGMLNVFLDLVSSNTTVSVLSVVIKVAKFGTFYTVYKSVSWLKYSSVLTSGRRSLHTIHTNLGNLPTGISAEALQC